MSTLRRSRELSPPTHQRRAPRFAHRRTRSWPCPSPARFSILYMYDLHDIVLQLSGDLDEANAPNLGRCGDEAISEDPRRLIVEMSALDTVDEAGLASLVGVRDRAEAAGVDFVLDSPSPCVTETLDRAGVRGSFFVR